MFQIKNMKYLHILLLFLLLKFKFIANDGNNKGVKIRKLRGRQSRCLYSA